jgi:hypothetical protein
VMDTRAGLDRVIGCYLRHLISPHFQTCIVAIDEDPNEHEVGSA